jgi:hypothetical protein
MLKLNEQLINRLLLVLVSSKVKALRNRDPAGLKAAPVGSYLQGTTPTGILDMFQQKWDSYPQVNAPT